MASCLQKIPSGNESRAEGENDEMGIPNYRQRSRLNYSKYFIIVRNYSLTIQDRGSTKIVNHSADGNLQNSQQCLFLDGLKRLKWL